MKPIDIQMVQDKINSFKNCEVFLHLETTSGAYTGYRNKTHTSSAYIRNSKIIFSEGKITGNGPFRVGLKLEYGWVYADGLTVWVFDNKNRLLLAGLDEKGKLAVSLQLSQEPF